MTSLLAGRWWAHPPDELVDFKMKIRASIVSFLLVGLVIVIALIMQQGGLRDLKRGDVSSSYQPIGLGEQVPSTVKGWTGIDEPLGPTEFLQSAVEKNLNYDDMVNRRYVKGDSVFGVYAGYWSPGRMPVQKVASHTPDRCWSENGWNCEEAKFPVILEADGKTLRPAYWRRFTPPGGSQDTFVLYWHLVGGELYDYGTGFNQRINPVAWWKETLHYAFKGSSEQFFIRLTSNKPFEEIWDEVGVQEIVGALAELGLVADAKRPVTGE